jgi:hypothetical protein
VNSETHTIHPNGPVGHAVGSSGDVSRHASRIKRYAAFTALEGGAFSTASPGSVPMVCLKKTRSRPRKTWSRRRTSFRHPQASADWVDFAFVRDRLDLSDSALSKQFATLEDAGYITIERPLSNRRRRVRVHLTEAGRAAFEGHVAALRAVVASAESETATL